MTPMTDIVRALGLAVRQVRRTHGWSQEALAAAAELNRSYVGEIERGQVVVSIVTVHKLARALGVPAPELLAQADALTTASHAKAINLAAIAC